MLALRHICAEFNQKWKMEDSIIEKQKDSALVSSKFSSAPSTGLVVEFLFLYFSRCLLILAISAVLLSITSTTEVSAACSQRELINGGRKQDKTSN